MPISQFAQAQNHDEHKELEQVHSWLNNLEELAERFAKAKAARVRLDHERKVVLSELHLEAEKIDSIKYKSLIAQDSYARRQPRYRELLDKLERVMYIEEKTSRSLLKRQWLFEAWRSEMAFTRSQIGRYGATT